MDNIQFRGKLIQTGEIVYGDLMHDNVGGVYIFPIDAENIYKEYEVYPESVGQYSCVNDKDEKRIYAGDTIEYYVYDSVCINPDCDPFNYIYESYIKKCISKVEFKNGMFCVEDGTPLALCGIDDLDDARTYLNANEDNGYTDINGKVIDENILGVKIIEINDTHEIS